VGEPTAGPEGATTEPSASPTETSARSLPLPDVTPIFRHLDDPDMTWQQCRRQRNADGSESSVWEKWLAFSPEPQYLSLYAKYDPGMIVRRHGHYSPHLVFVIEGELWVGDRLCPPGTHIELPFGAAFGPIRAGAGGARLFEVMLGDPRSWGDQPELFEQTLVEHGAEALPDVALDYPDWLQDLRQHWADAGDDEPSDDEASDEANEP
jgi:hypothetical protein